MKKLIVLLLSVSLLLTFTACSDKGETPSSTQSSVSSQVDPNENAFTYDKFLIEISKYVDGTADSKAVYTYDSEVEAVATFHQKMGGAMKNANYAFELVQVINEYGVVIESKYFERKTEEAETE